ncbi:MAG: tetratricopeptide repeat protein [Bacteroidales bacterium]|nr:tetratricopeptide repeat protein [Bacteroidales bacterium]
MIQLSKYQRILVVTGAVLLLLGSACSTRKNTFTRRAYHSLTTHYNVYWNGMMSVEEGATDLANSVKENYDHVLRVYNYGTKQDALALNQKMDRAIKKASIGIQRHSMYFGGKELNKWVKESYFMMGQAHFYKQDYTSARRVFDYVAKEYTKSPIQYEALLWLAKTYVQTERYEKAEATLNLLQSKSEESNFPLSVKKAIPLVYADYNIASGNYDQAYTYLQRGLELNNNKQLVTRIDFILGQVSQSDKSYAKATEYFEKVVKRNPPFEMAFRAKMNLAQCYDEGSGDSKYINKVLAKMAKESKNKEYLDQIYYAMAQVAEKDGQDTLVTYYLRKSVSSSVNNNMQKSTSALKLADLYFTKSQYMDAQAYYDTAVSSLPKEFPDYDQIKAKAEVLTGIVAQIQVIHHQDSLQYLAALDTTKLYAIVDKLIAEYVKEEQRLADEKADLEINETNQIFANVNNKQNPNLNSGKWYFYNSAALGYGRTEFQKKWGMRKLVDNWRLTDKKAEIQMSETEVDTENVVDLNDTTKAVVKANSPRTRNYYLADIPRTSEELAISDSLMVEAYHSLGFLYLEELRDTTSALTTYVEFQTKYPDSKYRLETWYALYSIYMSKGNTEEADFYKGLILGSYPESLYAKVINDPDYFIKLSQQKNEAAALYEKTYAAYTSEQYLRTITYADKGIELYPGDTSLVPKFLYLRAMSQGVVDVPDSLYASLYYIAGKYPKSAVGPLVRSVMNTLEQEYGMGYGTKTVSIGDTNVVTLVPYKYDRNATHLMMMVVLSPDVNLNALKIRISDFDKKYFDLKKLKVKSLMLDKDRSLVTVGNFDSEAEATNYLMALKNDTYVTSGVSNNDFKVFSISLDNYPLFYKDKNLDGYELFWKENYPQR